MKYLLRSTTAAVACTLASTPLLGQVTHAQAEATAAQTEDAGVETIIVTAQRRTQNLQDVPIAVTATTSARLESTGVIGAGDIGQLTAGLQMNVAVGFSRPHLRGVGTDSNGPGIENPVATYLDGVYLASSSASLLNLNNIDRVEVLRGPQGTLFGRNATGGLIQVVTRKPSHDVSANLNFGYSNYETAVFDGYATGGLSDTIAMDLAVHYLTQGDGYGFNLGTGHDVLRDDHDFAGRTKLLWQPAPSTSLVFSFDYAYRKSSGDTAFVQQPGTESYARYNNRFTTGGPYPFPKGFYELNWDDDPLSVLHAWGVSLDAEHQFDNVTLKSITAYRKSRYKFVFDLDSTPEDLLEFAPANTAFWRQFSQEFQLNGSIGKKFNWTVGLYYFGARDGYDPLLTTFGRNISRIFYGVNEVVAVRLDDAQKTDSYAGYVQGTWEFLPETRLTLGGRYTHETRDFSGTTSTGYNNVIISSASVPPGSVDPHAEFNNFSYRIALDHSFTPNILSYVSYNTGFKSGGYNPGVPTQQPYDEERIQAWEAGLRTELFNRRLRLNGAIFNYQYTNIQVARYVLTSLEVYNGAKARIYGADLDMEAVLSRNLTLYGSVSYVHDRFTDFANADYSYLVPNRGCVANAPGSSSPFRCSAVGNKLAFSPTFSGNIGFNWRHDFAGGEISLNGNVHHNSGWFGGVDNNPVTRQKAYQVVNGSVSWISPGERYRITLWGRNLTDEKYARTRNITPAGGAKYNPAPPLTYGFTVGLHF